MAKAEAVHQALFGYEDGHKLIASSLKLPTDAAVDLTVLSDLAPGVRFEGSGGYYTGLPLPSLKRYALMRTWPAPEMPRPGCVWSHVLLLETEFLGGVPDLATLTRLFRRPGHGWNKADYARPLAGEGDAGVDLLDHAATDTESAELLAAYYGTPTPRPIETTGRVPEATVFRMWSQQWPRLRRNFRFQTAVIDRVPDRAARFDLRFGRARGAAVEPISRLEQFDAWLPSAVLDLGSTSVTPMRTFLREFGGDVSRPRAAFAPLVAAYTSTRVPLRGSAALRLLTDIAEAFPEPSDGASLKSAVVGQANKDIAVDTIDLVRFLLGSSIANAFPQVSDEALVGLAGQWHRRDDLLELADEASSSESGIANSVLAAIVADVPDSEVWALGRERSWLRKAVLRARPWMLADDRVRELDLADLLEALSRIPQDASYVKDVIASLMALDRPTLTEWAFERHREIAVQTVVEEVGSGRPFAPAWIHALANHPDLVLTSSTLGRARNTFTLSQVLRAFEFDPKALTAAGATPWVAGLQSARDNLSRDEDLQLKSRLLGLAIGSADSGREALLNAVFDPLYEAAQGYPSPLVRAAMDAVLPKLKTRNSDLPLRLLVAVVEAYVFGDFKKAAFGGVTQRKRTRKTLHELLESFEGGRRFLTQR